MDTGAADSINRLEIKECRSPGKNSSSGIRSRRMAQVTLTAKRQCEVVHGGDWLHACTEQGSLLGVKRQIQKLRHVYVTSVFLTAPCEVGILPSLYT